MLLGHFIPQLAENMCYSEIDVIYSLLFFPKKYFGFHLLFQMSCTTANNIMYMIFIILS